MLVFFNFVSVLSENFSVVTTNDGYVLYIFDKPGKFSFQVPSWVSEIFVKMWGSSGDNLELSGAGGYSEGVILVNESDIYGVEVGSPSITIINNKWRTYFYAGSRSAIWKSHELNEIIVAGGGGAGELSPGMGGAGGGLNGQSSMEHKSADYYPEYNPKSYARSAGGGTQFTGGAGALTSTCEGHYPGVSGGRNYGSRGQGKLDYHEGGAGGGGYYGGGSGGASCYCKSGGGGGSGFVSPSVLNGVTMTGNYTTPANPNDPQRGNAGSPGNNGIVIIRMKSIQTHRSAHRGFYLLFSLMFV